MFPTSWSSYHKRGHTVADGKFMQALKFAANEGLVTEPGDHLEVMPMSKNQPQASQATILVELASDVTLWHTPELEAFASIPVADHWENHKVTSRSFHLWLSRQFYSSKGSVPNAQALKDALSVLGGKATFEGAEKNVFIRAARYQGAIYLDVGDSSWRAIEITATGWRIVQNPPVKFRRSSGMLALPIPVQNGSIAELKRFVNVGGEDNWALLAAWVVMALNPKGPYPVLVLHGEQGSAKSTLARLLRCLVDPNKADLRSEPRNLHDLVISASNGWIVALDNLSHLPGWLSDGICRLATGGGFGTRTLYENDEETLFRVQRPVVINAIEELAARGDLLDRAIVLYLPAILPSARRDEGEFWQDFERSCPSILGALLDGLVRALCDVDAVKLATLPRMADFARWSVAAVPALGVSPEFFLRAYDRNRNSANSLTLEASSITQPLYQLLRVKDWEGNATDLLEVLSSLVSDNTRKLREWPKNGRSLSGKLRRLAPNLRALGYAVDFDQTAGSGSSKIITIRKSTDICDASDAGDGNVSVNEPPVDSRDAVVATRYEDVSDATQSRASQSVDSVAKSRGYLDEGEI